MGTDRLYAFRELDMNPFRRQEIFRGPSFGVVQILVRYRVSFYVHGFRSAAEILTASLASFCAVVG